MTKPFSTSDDAPLDRDPMPVPPLAEPQSGAATWDQVDDSAQTDPDLEQGAYGNPRDAADDPSEGSE